MKNNDELSDLVGDSNIIKFNDNTHHTFLKKHMAGFAYTKASTATSKLFIFFTKSLPKYTELWYYKEKHDEFLKDLQVIQKHFED